MVRVKIVDSQAFSSIKPIGLMRYLEVNGWREVRRVEGELVVLRKADQLVWMPSSDQFTDYAPMVARLVKTVAETDDKSELQVLDDLQTVAVGDIIRVGTYNPLDEHDHTIPLPDGLHLLNQARAMALAAASSVIDKRPVHSRKPVFEARQFVQDLRLAQTERGSFLLRLIAPIEPKEQSAELDSMPSELPFARRVVLQLVQGLKALKEAAEDSNRRGKFVFHSFLELVPNGVSANLCEAVVSEEDKSISRPIEVSVTWSYALPVQANLPTNPISFEPVIIPFIRQAAKEFRVRNPELITIQGWVNILEREKPSAPGLIRILSTIDGAPRPVRVQLEKEDYERAVDAHKKGDLVAVKGVLVKEGWVYRLNSPTGLQVIEQLELFDSAEND